MTGHNTDPRLRDTEMLRQCMNNRTIGLPLFRRLVDRYLKSAVIGFAHIFLPCLGFYFDGELHGDIMTDMNKPLKYLAIALVAAAAVAAYMYYDKNAAIAPSPSSSPTVSGSPRACTLEAKICPDGTAVGRVGPNCEFAPCPTPRSTTQPANQY